MARQTKNMIRHSTNCTKTTQEALFLMFVSIHSFVFPLCKIEMGRTVRAAHFNPFYW